MTDETCDRLFRVMYRLTIIAFAVCLLSVAAGAFWWESWTRKTSPTSSTGALVSFLISMASLAIATICAVTAGLLQRRKNQGNAP